MSRAESDLASAPTLRPFTDRDHPNARLLKDAHECFQRGELDRLFTLFSPDMRWHVPGRHRLSGDFIGREQIVGNFRTLATVTDEYWAYPLDYFGSDDHAVLVARVRARRGDRTLDARECLLFRVEDRRLLECWHLALDPEAWEAFFA
jgi:ketosteroid isomerase-like protein